MSIKKAVEKIKEFRTELEDQYEELRAEIEARFGKRRDDDEVFRPLPEPRGMQMTLMRALQTRRSERNFSNEPLTDQMVSNLLFAADGINRKNGRRTTPSALDWRETDIYLLKSNGIWRWVPERRGLLFCAKHDVREASYVISTQLTLPPLEIVYVTNKERTRNLLTEAVETLAPKIARTGVKEDDLEEMRLRAYHLDVGVKVQSVYLAAAAMRLACVARTGFPAARLAEALHLKDDEMVVAAQSVGYPARSILDHIK
ncbi:nitroreductase family protein [Sutterella sp.]|uniref:nitroreductase family protein n=1 Tax=Sutterella sp. TaxID=1981025 RepID=UPI0026DFA2BC|nr:nitroreductase family protein [Sutterella sp.]MDO5530957.1 nitroreductase family protein [Sutterella sp.]